MEGMRMIPFKKLRCVSSICLMSFAQVILISGDDARRMKRCMLPSILRDVNTIRQGSSGQRSSMPKQLIYERYKYRNKHLSSYLFGFQSSTFSSPWCWFYRCILAGKSLSCGRLAHWGWQVARRGTPVSLWDGRGCCSHSQWMRRCPVARVSLVLSADPMNQINQGWSVWIFSLKYR